MRKLFIAGGALVLVSGFAIHSLAYAAGFAGPSLMTLSYLVIALGIISIVLGLLTDRKQRSP